MIVLGGDYEHTLGMGQSDEDHAAGIVYKPQASPAGYFKLVLNRADFEAAECSLSNYIMYRGNEDHWLTAIPVFPIRAFRYGDVVVRKDSAFHQFRDLVGKKVGVNDYSQTLAVWMRGCLSDEYDLNWRDVHWVSVANQRFVAPAGAKLTTTEKDLEDLLTAGEIDAVIKGPLRDSRKPPAERQLRPLIDDPRGEEVRYFRRTGIFPIRHTVVIRREAYEREPKAAYAIFRSYAQAKKAALQRRLGATFLPWGEQSWNDAEAIFGADSHPYGLTDANQRQARKLVEYLVDQGLMRRFVTLEELFVPGSAEWQE